MAASTTGPLPTFTLSQIQAWDTDHLETAATHWTATAAHWRDGFTAVSSGIDRPGGTAWEGASAEAASARAERDRVQVLGLVDRLHDASSIARSGAAELTAAKSRALASVENAQRAGFTVSEDLSVRDPLTVPSKPIRLIRDVQAQAFSADIRAQSTILAATDQSVASKLSTIAAGFTGFEFRESPFPQEPPPPPVPMPPYEPKVWGACAARGAHPNKVVRTFNRAAITAGFRSLSAGDSVLYCGNEKYGLLHLYAKGHDADWEAFTFPWMGNWRNLADYAIGAALAYPESVTYRQSNDTFAIERAIYPINAKGEISGPSTWKVHVVISASDGKIVTAYPMRTK
jgi:hypothetical protein